MGDRQFSFKYFQIYFPGQYVDIYCIKLLSIAKIPLKTMGEIFPPFFISIKQTVFEE